MNFVFVECVLIVYVDHKITIAMFDKAWMIIFCERSFATNDRHAHGFVCAVCPRWTVDGEAVVL